MNFIAILAAAITLQLSPGLSEPVGGDGARVDAAVLVSTNATATAAVAAVYDLPVYDDVVLSIETNWIETAELGTNYVVTTNWSPTATSIWTVDAPYGVVTTNYWSVATNEVVGMVVTRRPVFATNTAYVATKPVTNAIFSLTASGGFAETNNVDRCLAPGARLLLNGSEVTVFLK